MAIASTMEKKISIESSPENIHLVESFVEEINKELRFKEDVYGNVMIAVTEAVNNSIYHGNLCDPQKKVEISCRTINPYRIAFTIADEGKGFNPTDLADPTSPEFLEKPGGRGVFLMQHLSDELKFHREGREVEMHFNI